MTLEETGVYLKQLEQKLRVYEAKDEIRELQYHYINVFSAADWDAVMECFAGDCSFALGHMDKAAHGKAELEKLFREFFSKGHAGRDCNIVVHPIITVNGDDATGSWTIYQLFSYQRTGQMLFMVKGFYDMQYSKENGKWKIKGLKYTRTICPPGDPPYPGV